MLKKAASLNFDSRVGVKKPSMIILHYTGMQSEDAALERLCNPTAKVSSHYFISENGETLNLVDESKRAWHAGISYWNGKTDINSESIGIEIVNPGHEFGYRPFSSAQIKSVSSLCVRLIDRYAIPAFNVLGHSDIAPKRKEDPGELFPWKQLASEGVGAWPRTTDGDLAAGQAMLKKGDFKKHLVKMGYNPDVPEENLIVAFHRHFYPEKFFKSSIPEEPDSTTGARILALLRAKPAPAKAKT